MEEQNHFLSDFFQRLAREKISYCLLKNFAGVPQAWGRDIDIWVAAGQRKAFLKILFAVARERQWALVGVSRRISFHSDGEYYFCKIDHVPDKPVICIDMFVYLQRRGLSYLDEKAIARHLKTSEKGFNVASEGIEAASMIFRGAMMGKVKESDKPRIISCLRADPGSFLDVLQDPFGGKRAGMLLDLVLKQRWDDLSGWFPRLRRDLLIRALLKKPFFQIKQWLVYYSSRVIIRLTGEQGCFVVFIGPDGSGKTTAARRLLESDTVKKLFLNRVYLYRRFVIPWQRRVVSAIKREKRSEPPLPVQRGFLSSIFYILYLAMEFILGHLSLCGYKANSAIVVFDRYFYDYLSFSDFQKCPRWLIFFLLKFIPRPDMVFYLKSDPELIFARKPERPVGDIERQIKIFDGLFRKLPHCFIVDSSAAPEEVAAKIEEGFIETQKERYCKIFSR